MLNKINLDDCEILSFESFDIFISKRTKVEYWWFWENYFTATELSIIFQTLSENNTMKNLYVYEWTNYKEYQEKKTIIGGVKQFWLI
eukprot:snap_masked-scaffold_63-processed-gene-0.32-mRNA-1 protein AED:1.00 eAED:1.00 QI:0/0/0/0/1/1/5/0/86